MANLNKLNCATLGSKNTGFGSCFLDPKEIIGAFIVPNDFEIDDSDLGSPGAVYDALIAAAKDDTALERIYPVHNFLEVTDGTEKKVLQTYKSGGKSVVREGDYDWTFMFTQGGLCLLKALRAFNSNGAWSVLFYDKQYMLYGRLNSDDNLAGIPTRILWAEPWTIGDGSKAAAYMIQFVFLPVYMNEGIAFVQGDSTLPDVTGLQDIELVKNTWNEDTGVAHITAQTDCGGINLGDFFATELAVNSLWQAINRDTGDGIAITSVAYDDGTKRFTVTLNTADPDYPTDNAGILLSLKAVSVLTTGGIPGYENPDGVVLPTTSGS